MCNCESVRFVLNRADKTPKFKVVFKHEFFIIASVIYNRAIVSKITDERTRPMAIDALKWAAYTYVIAAIGSLATLLYYIGLARGRD